MTIHIPRDIAIIFTKPGVEWMPEEKERVIRWLCEQNQLNYLVRFALGRLGKQATPEDVEDVLGDFYEKRLSRVMESYDPAKGKENFWNYLLFCFENFCHDERPKIVRRREHEVPPLKPEDDGGERIKFEIVDTSLISDPEAIYALIECINRLPSRYREQVLAELNCGDNHNPDISEVNIRVMRLRAKQMLAKCLQGVNL